MSGLECLIFCRLVFLRRGGKMGVIVAIGREDPNHKTEYLGYYPLTR